MIATACPSCGRQFHVKTEYAGRKAKCTECDHVFDVPTATDHATVRCDHCHSQFPVRRAILGREAACSQCQSTFTLREVQEMASPFASASQASPPPADPSGLTFESPSGVQASPAPMGLSAAPSASGENEDIFGLASALDDPSTAGGSPSRPQPGPRRSGSQPGGPATPGRRTTIPKVSGTVPASPQELLDEINRGGRFVRFQYAVSVIVLSMRLSSGIYYIPPGGSRVSRSLPFILLSFLLGPWGFPFGPIFVIWALIVNLSGGEDLTQAFHQSVLEQIGYTEVTTATAWQTRL